MHGTPRRPGSRAGTPGCGRRCARAASKRTGSGALSTANRSGPRRNGSSSARHRHRRRYRLAATSRKNQAAAEDSRRPITVDTDGKQRLRLTDLGYLRPQPACATGWALPAPVLGSRAAEENAMAEPALAYLPDPVPCPALAAKLAEDEHTLPETDGLPLADGRVQQGPLTYSRDALRYHLPPARPRRRGRRHVHLPRRSGLRRRTDPRSALSNAPRRNTPTIAAPSGGHTCADRVATWGRRLRHPQPQRRQGDTEGSRQGATRPVNARPCRRNGS